MLGSGIAPPSCRTCSANKPKAQPVGRASQENKRLLFLIFVLHRFDAAIVLGLRLRVFHGFLGFGGFLGTSFGALFLLLVEDLLAAQQLEESLVGAVALIPVRADDARVAAVAIAKTRPDRIKQ